MLVLGLPIWVWGMACLVVVTLYTRFPGKPRFYTIGPARWVLRWFHSIVWLFLAAACFIAPVEALGGTTTATILALGGLFSYVIYMTTLFRDRLAKLPPPDETKSQSS